MSRFFVVGIDPGIRGALCLLDEKRKLVELSDMPTITPIRKLEVDPVGVSEVLRGFKKLTRKPIIVNLESVGARPGQGVTSMFNFGQGYGVLRGVIACLDLTCHLITPQRWKSEAGLIGGTKQDSIDLARKHYPSAPIYLKKHDGRAEALLIGLYGVTYEH